MKPPSSNKSFDSLLHPYAFVLKEGEEFQKNLLNYSLLLLQVGRADIIPSPRSKKASTPTIQLLRK